MELTMGIGEGPVELRMGFDPFFHAHFASVARTAALVARDLAAGQDLAQEAFTRVLERWADMESNDHARNSCTRSRSTWLVPTSGSTDGLPLRAPRSRRCREHQRDRRRRRLVGDE